MCLEYVAFLILLPNFAKKKFNMVDEKRMALNVNKSEIVFNK